MTYPDLPRDVKNMLADKRHRTHHHLWHFVRNRDRWNGLTDTDRNALTNEGWAAPRFEEERGSGIDFLGMHRQMITMTNKALAVANDPNWLSVTGWDPIPWAEDDTEWPVPDWQTDAPPWADPQQWQRFTEIANDARSSETVQLMQQLAERFRDTTNLRGLSLDDLGINMEWSIHAWMHNRWSGAPNEDVDSEDVSNDWLFFPWSSHVNKTFWKLHGWIDARISDWESATGRTADLSQTWAGPAGVPGTMPHMADVRLLNHLPSPDKHPSPMMVRRHVVESLLR